MSVSREEIGEAEDLREIAEIIRDNTDWDEIIVCAGDNEEQRVGYGYTREEWQTLREIVGTVDMVRYLIMRDHFEFREEVEERLRTGGEFFER